MVTTKNIRVFLYPKKKGQFTIPEITYSWFNPSKKKYETAKAGPWNIEVEKGEAAPEAIFQAPVAQGPAAVQKQEIESLGSDIRFIHKVSDSAGYTAPYKSILYWVIFAAAIPFYLIVTFAVRSRRKHNSDAALVRKGKADKMLKARFADARTALQKGDAKALYAALENGLINYLSDKTNLEFKGMTRRFEMKKFSLILMTLIVACATMSFAAEHCSGIETGAKAYNEGDFERAVDEWRTCADNGIENSDLYYNLGNAYFRGGKLGFAIYYYKSALRLDPSNDDILHNLKYAQAMTRDKVDEDGEENPLLAGLFKAHHALSLKAQMFVLLGLFWAMALIAIARRISRSDRQKNILIGTLFVLSAIFCIIAMSAGYKVFVAETEIEGVVTAKDADVTSAPSDKSQTLNTLSEGTTFEVLSEQGNFAEIRLGEKVRGFVKQSDIGIVKN